MIPAWRDEAACIGMDPEMFYDSDRSKGRGGSFTTSPATKLALATCERCPVASECLEDEMQHADQWGVRGGYTARDRYRMNRRAVS